MKKIFLSLIAIGSIFNISFALDFFDDSLPALKYKEELNKEVESFLINKYGEVKDLEYLYYHIYLFNKEWREKIDQYIILNMGNQEFETDYEFLYNFLYISRVILETYWYIFLLLLLLIGGIVYFYKKKE